MLYLYTLNITSNIEVTYGLLREKIQNYSQQAVKLKVHDPRSEQSVQVVTERGCIGESPSGSEVRAGRS